MRTVHASAEDGVYCNGMGEVSSLYEQDDRSERTKVR